MTDDPHATPEDATETTEEQRALQEQLDHQDDDPAGPGKVDRHQIAEETTR